MRVLIKIVIPTQFSLYLWGVETVKNIRNFFYLTQIFNSYSKIWESDLFFPQWIWWQNCCLNAGEVSCNNSIVCFCACLSSERGRGDLMQQSAIWPPLTGHESNAVSCSKSDVEARTPCVQLTWFICRTPEAFFCLWPGALYLMGTIWYVRKLVP